MENADAKHDDLPERPGGSRVKTAVDAGSRQELSLLWTRRWRIMIITAVCGIMFAAVGALITPEYEASVTVLPLSSGNAVGMSGLSSASSLLGGLGSAIGLSQLGGSFKEEAVATLKSNMIAAQYIKIHKLLPILFSKQWNASAGKWRSMDSEKLPTMWKAVRLFRRKIRTVEKDRQSGLVTLTIKWSNPKRAADWANGLVALTNEYLRARAIKRAENHIAFLNAQISETNQVDLRRDIYTLMESELKQEMLARGRTDYALRVVDPAMVPERPVTPSILKMTVIGLFLGLLLSGIWAIWRQ